MGGNRSGSRARGYPSPFFKLISPRSCGPIAHKKGPGWMQKNELVEFIDWRSLVVEKCVWTELVGMHEVS